MTSPAVPTPAPLRVTAVEREPSGLGREPAGRVHVRVVGEWLAGPRVVAPLLVVDDGARRRAFPARDASPPGDPSAFHATFEVPEELGWERGATLRLGPAEVALSVPAPARPAPDAEAAGPPARGRPGAPARAGGPAGARDRPEQDASARPDPGARVIDNALLAERRARRAEQVEQELLRRAETAEGALAAASEARAAAERRATELEQRAAGALADDARRTAELERRTAQAGARVAEASRAQAEAERHAGELEERAAQAAEHAAAAARARDDAERRAAGLDRRLELEAVSASERDRAAREGVEETARAREAAGVAERERDEAREAARLAGLERDEARRAVRSAARERDEAREAARLAARERDDARRAAAEAERAEDAATALLSRALGVAELTAAELRQARADARAAQEAAARAAEDLTAERRRRAEAEGRLVAQDEREQLLRERLAALRADLDRLGARGGADEPAVPGLDVELEGLGRRLASPPARDGVPGDSAGTGFDALVIAAERLRERAEAELAARRAEDRSAPDGEHRPPMAQGAAGPGVSRAGARRDPFAAALAGLRDARPPRRHGEEEPAPPREADAVRRRRTEGEQRARPTGTRPRARRLQGVLARLTGLRGRRA